MGICLSCCGENSSSEPRENNERTHLLSDPVNNISNSIARVQSDDYLSRTPNAAPKSDEQSALSRILIQTATNVIDVGALDSHDLEQHEYYERMKAYSARLIGLVRWNPPSKSGLLLVDVPVPDKLLAADTISLETYRLVTSALESLTEAVVAVRVEHKEDLVVPFQIP